MERGETAFRMVVRRGPSDLCVRRRSVLRPCWGRGWGQGESLR